MDGGGAYGGNGGSDRAALARSRSGRLGRGLRAGRPGPAPHERAGGRSGVAARATLDLGALAAGLGTHEPAAAPPAHHSGGGLGARIRALFGGGGGAQDSNGGGAPERRGGIAGMRSRKERRELRETRPEKREPAQVDGRRPSAVAPDVAHIAGTAAPAANGKDHHPEWDSTRQSGRLFRGGGAPAKPTAASSLGSLQSYAQNTVKDSGPLPGCFRTSTSEVEPVRRFERRPGASAGGSAGIGSSGSGGVADYMRSGSSSQPGGSATDDELVFSDQVRKNGLLSRRPDAFEYPRFALAEYGSPNTWNSDVFVLIHNAIRWEIMDLYTIIGSLQRRWLALTMLDIYEFSEYWEVFELFIAQTFEIEDQIIFPYLLNIAASSEDLARYYKSVKFSKENLVGMLYDIGATIEMFNTTPSGEVLPALYQQLVDYLPKLLDYMEQQDTVLPAVFATHCHPEDRIMLNRAVANFLIRAANGRHGIAFLTRWIEDSMILQIWKDENLSARAKSSHKKWLTRFDEQHVDIARRFQRRLRSGKPSMQLKDEELTAPQLPDRRDPASLPQLASIAV